ncbi:hypothetical protein PV08_01169 [Exophiala spinifera]|uniref:Uncharacterized protein n=1 Tax=Exophiala spinifera TaxID=91928 RepID=A0A0D2CAJ8_9EURO|nr:uncharacterized protein PV08_01169 [Exophiala spinifera]KIW20594.1 hypothetical protein PV08_01169 [Exophiala spinifera]
MEHDLRSFKSVNIGLTCLETGSSRFTRDGIYRPPPVAFWRNNLTALSQRYNLYFVALRDAFAVYRPEFPFQRLHWLPSLVIPPELANPSAQGYIDPHHPHNINHIMVDDLGSEEILLLSTDSGNLTAYFTKAIDEAIRKDPYRFSTNARSDCVGVRAFFTQWVYESAWGLSIHSKARMIAVSANTPNHVPSDDPCSKITVFAFALTEHGSGYPILQIDAHANSQLDVSDLGLQQDWEEWDCRRPDSGPPPRNRNYKITLGGLEGHNDNVPSISFVNTDDDPDGRWLLSTDIRGEMKMWQIWRGLCLRTWSFAEKRMRGGFQSRREGGWIVAALDSRAFRSAWTMEQFCGHTKAPQYYGHVGESYDLTNIVRLRTPGISLAHPHAQGFSPADAPVEEEEVQEQTYDGWSDLDDSGDEQANANSGPIAQDVLGAGHPMPPTVSISPLLPQESEATESGILNNLDIDVDVQASDADGSEELSEHDADSGMLLLFDHEQYDDDVEDDEMQYGSSSEDQEEQSYSSSRRSTPSLSSLAQRNSEALEQQPGDTDTDSSSFMEHHHLAATAIQGAKSTSRQTRGIATRKDILQIPTLHCTASHLRLLMAPQASSPHVFCANILKQALPEYIEMTNHVHLDRINMVQQIPELGIVIVATQIGRCAICTTTRNEKTGTLGLRVDWVLPTTKQEARHLRPAMPLLGIAASPIQGRFRGEEHKSRPAVEMSVEWGKDAVVDGVTTTFDPESAAVVEDGVEEVTCPISAREQGKHGKMPECPTRFDPSTSNHTPQHAAWTKPEAIEPWMSTESSRRYRLMLTYLDMSVLTYEISRGVEREDLLLRETSTLEDID